MPPNLSLLLKSLDITEIKGTKTTTEEVNEERYPGSAAKSHRQEIRKRPKQRRNRKIPLVFKKNTSAVKRRGIYEAPHPSLSAEGSHQNVENNDDVGVFVQRSSECQCNNSEVSKKDSEIFNKRAQFEQHDDDDNDYETDSSTTPPPLINRVRKQQGRIPRGRIAWTASEVQFLLQNFPKFKHRYNVWRCILHAGADVFHPSRTNVSLKDKWRQLADKFH